MSHNSVLVVDDEKALREFVRRNLEVRDNIVFTASNGLEALAIFEKEYIDLVIMDVMMPNMDGIETIRRIRKTSHVPIIVLSALGEESDKVKALNLGADDYLSKPFGVEELLARIQAVKRRSQWIKAPGSKGNLSAGNIHLDFDKHLISLNGEAIDCTPTEFSLLRFLMENEKKVMTHQFILQNVWGMEYGQEAEYLRVYIGKLRQKLENTPTRPQYIHTERGIGYCFDYRPSG